MLSIKKRIEQAQADASWDYVKITVVYHTQKGGRTEKVRKNELTSVLKSIEVDLCNTFEILNRGSTILEVLHNHPLYHQIEIEPRKL